MSNFIFTLPTDFADYEWEVIAKGYFSDARMTVSGKHYQLNFYDTTRLGQEIESELERGGVFFESNVVIIRSVTKSNMESAVEHLMQSGQVNSLTPDVKP